MKLIVGENSLHITLKVLIVLGFSNAKLMFIDVKTVWPNFCYQDAIELEKKSEIPSLFTGLKPKIYLRKTGLVVVGVLEHIISKNITW